MILPANHLSVVVDRDVGSVAVVVGAKVAVRCTEPFIKTVLQRQVLWPVSKMPAVTNIVRSHTDVKINVTEGEFKFRPLLQITHITIVLHIIHKAPHA